MIFSHESEIYKERWRHLHGDRYNGAYYYSKEIVENIIPKVKTDMNWVTVNVKGMAWDNSIVFVHNNKRPENYQWLSGYKNIVLVCGVKETCDKVKEYGTPIYLPLSIDRKYVEQFKTEKTKEKAFVGRKAKRNGIVFDDDTDYLEGMERDRLLSLMAEYKEVYAVGRCAIEAKALGCKVLPYDDRFPDQKIWRVRDNSTAARELQRELNKLGAGDC